MEPVTSPKSWQAASGAAAPAIQATNKARRVAGQEIAASEPQGRTERRQRGSVPNLAPGCPFPFRGRQLAAYDFCNALAPPGAWPHDASISSSERPRVSGTPTMTQTRPMAQNAAKSQKV